MEKTIIKFENFSFRYESQKSFTLKNINLEIKKGEKVLILGSSGSGKSTLGSCINGLIPNQYKGEIKGTCEINGNNIANSTIFSLSKYVGTVLQDSDAQFVGLNVAEDIAFSLENQNYSVQDMKNLVYKSAKIVGVENNLSTLPYLLSGGEKQRVSIAGIIHEDIEVLLLDEPLAALDPKMGEKMIELIDDFNKQGKTIVIIEHRFEEVLHRNVDKVVLVDNGEIVKIGTPDEMIVSNILTKYGIREPLYIEALKNMYGGLKQNENLTKFEDIDLSRYENIKIDISNGNIKNYGEDIIRVKNGKFSYTDKELINIEDLYIKRGEKIAVLGKNGSGKTTFAKLLTGALKFNSGEIWRIGTPESIQEIAYVIGYVMQNPNQMLVTHNVYEEVALALKLRNYSEDIIAQKVDEVLKITGLYSKRNWPISSLSYGQKKRLSVAIVLVLDPLCLILDEPTAGQDFKHYRKIMDFISKIAEKKNITLIFITHDMHLALEYTDRAIVMNNGKIIGDKNTFEILDDEKLVEKASLKKTSIFNLAKEMNENVLNFLNTFIHSGKDLYE